MPPFPQSDAHVFFIVKGALAFTAVLLVLFHMNTSWHRIARASLAQQWRYYALLGFVATVAAATVEQVQHHQHVYYYNIGLFVMIAVAIIAMVLSIREDYHLKRRRNRS
jgi:hypothetical protein